MTCGAKFGTDFLAYPGGSQGGALSAHGEGSGEGEAVPALHLLTLAPRLSRQEAPRAGCRKGPSAGLSRSRGLIPCVPPSRAPHPSSGTRPARELRSERGCAPPAEACHLPLTAPQLPFSEPGSVLGSQQAEPLESLHNATSIFRTPPITTLSVCLIQFLGSSRQRAQDESLMTALLLPVRASISASFCRQNLQFLRCVCFEICLCLFQVQ